ncbi:MAG: sigma-54-dependent Fis family transcriptional regulator [Deltaproteobacteria bacterium]|nr:sigma-54-dependent Fis family transcriptional regulator [Deltaproteobacteria bacterium]TLN00507.1 MAG: sigma-54-dependent Fis family transcriptional regulator [bacterium]
MTAQVIHLIEEAWNRYITNDVLDAHKLRPEVAHSWQRCRNFKVDPYGQQDTDIDGNELKDVLQASQHLIKIARPFIHNLYGFVKGSGFQVVLTDNDGLIVEAIGDPEILKKTKQIQLCPGGLWSESAKGTNAIGTAIMEKKPIQIFAREHFCQPHHYLTCSASPIFDPEGQMVGVLDITGDYKAFNPHTLSLVVAAVSAIENQLRLHKTTSKLYVSYRFSNTLLETISDGVIAVDSNGVINQLNSYGGKLLGADPKLSIGKHIANVLKKPSAILQVLSTGVEYRDHELFNEDTGKKVNQSVSPLRDDTGRTIGALAILRENRERQSGRRSGSLTAKYVFDDIIGQSESVSNAKKWGKIAAGSPSTVLLTGESGTGKELFAQAIHNGSARKDRPFIAINCAALPDTLIESELFGYEEGSFTGSKKGGQAGKFELANGGTIFLDEIGDIPLYTQVKLLRVIQEKKISRIGSSGEINVDIRIIAATHKDLKEEVQRGNFRKDLYYRLNVITINIASLRDRMDDLPLLAKHFITKLSLKLNRKNISATDDFYDKLKTYSWPGNIRELENAIERGLNLITDNGVLVPELLHFDSPGPAKIGERITDVKSLKDIERDAIVQALNLYKGNILKVSAKLGVGRNTLYRKIKEYDIK